MASYFLNNGIKIEIFRDFHKKFFHISLLMCVFGWNTFAQVLYSRNDISSDVERVPNQEQLAEMATDNIPTAVEIVRNEFLTGQPVNIEEYELFLDNFWRQCDFSEDEKLLQILDSFNLYATMQTTHSTKESIERINKFEKQIRPYVQKSKNPDVIHEYASYLYSKISWSKNRFSIIEELPFWYKKSVRLGATDKAGVFYAVWLINAVTSKESNWISYIKQKENLMENLDLKKSDLFNCYLAYSMFYMKTLDTKKGFEYLEKAERLYPNNYFTALLEINYNKGRYGW